MNSRVFPGRRCRLLLLPAMSLVSGTSEALETGTGLLNSVGSDDVTRIGDMLRPPRMFSEFQTFRRVGFGALIKPDVWWMLWHSK